LLSTAGGNPKSKCRQEPKSKDPSNTKIHRPLSICKELFSMVAEELAAVGPAEIMFNPLEPSRPLIALGPDIRK
jgi:hypothetical protein